MRTGKNAKEIFTSTTAPPQVAAKPGRPLLHTEEWTKVTVVLMNRQIIALDRLATDIRENTGIAISRAELIRSMVDAVLESNLDLTQAESEREVKKLVKSKLAPQ